MITLFPLACCNACNLKGQHSIAALVSYPFWLHAFYQAHGNRGIIYRHCRHSLKYLAVRVLYGTLRITIGNSPPSEPKPYKANFYYTGIFTYFTGIEISIPVFSITIPQVSISIPALMCYENLRIKTIIFKR